MTYKIHHLNCATLCPSNRRLINGETGLFNLFKKGLLVCHCLLIETDQGLVLVDTGFSFDDVTGKSWKNTLTFKSLGAQLNPDECAVSQIRRLGFRPEDVTHILLTHLDFDHGSGVRDFPNAKVHVFEKEYEAAKQPITLWENMRYQSDILSVHSHWQLHGYQGERWHGFEKVNVLSNHLYDILLVPLTGHSRGHCGVAVSTENGWLLHCGDAYFHHTQLEENTNSCPVGLNAIQIVDETSRADRLNNIRRLTTLKHDRTRQVKLFCSHDHHEFEQCCHASERLGRADSMLSALKA